MIESYKKKPRVIIGIQCRTKSERLPNKALLKVGEKSIIEHIVSSCCNAAKFVNGQKYGCHTIVKLLIPKNDTKLIDVMGDWIDVIEGPEDDVLSRYVKAANSNDADYIVRITGDCLYIPSYTISRHIKWAVKDKADYCSNVLERMQPEGFDVEVMSRQLLNYLDQVSETGYDREHVTSKMHTLIHDKRFIETFSISSSKETMDLSHLKTSIDTLEEYETAVANFKRRGEKISRLLRYGKVF